MESQAHASRVLRAANFPRRTTRRAEACAPAAGSAGAEPEWAMDFMTETHYDDPRVQLLTVLDEGKRKGLEIVAGVSVQSRRVIRVLEALVVVHGRPSAILVDNGPEFTASPSSTGALITALRFTTCNGQAGSERVYRALLQSHLSHRSAQRASL